MNALDLANTLFRHPIRDIAAVVLALALCAGVVLWPGWTEAKWRAVTVACFLYALPLWAWLHVSAGWARFNRVIGRRL